MSAPLPAPALPSALRETLEHLLRCEHTTQQHARRIRIVLELSEGPSARAVASRLGVTDVAVRRWYRAIPGLLAIFDDGQPAPSTAQLENRVLACLQDDYRPGAPPTYTPEQICQIISLATENPEDSGRPISHWSARELADEANRRTVTQKISARSVGRYLDEADLHPHKMRYWMNKKKGIQNNSRLRSRLFAMPTPTPSPRWMSAAPTPSR